ncbi:MAG TPA: GTP 3',8-cyclase MoaA [Terriglobales bacterium]|nr:GTP 3',8-cyclase MoaA [Terriglobales bacterium]
MPLADSFGRRINYLRLSVTDRCNLRCQYCMPSDGVPKLCHSDILSYEDLFRIAKESVALGVEKLRITGGEPLVRKGIVEFVRSLSGLVGLKEIVLTTNGVLLPETAVALRQAGLRRLNVSLDSLKPQTFAAITRGGDLRRVLNGLAAAEEAGFPAAKINMVVMRGINDDEVLDFAALTLSKSHTVRFIEYMPTAQNPQWRSLHVSGDEILERVRQRFTVTELVAGQTSGPARNYRIEGAAGAIGVITPISRHFCQQCNRIRITASGFAKACLFGRKQVDLKPCLASGDNSALRELLREIVVGKPDGHQLLTPNRETAPFSMSQIGG